MNSQPKTDTPTTEQSNEDFAERRGVRQQVSPLFAPPARITLGAGLSQPVGHTVDLGANNQFETLVGFLEKHQGNEAYVCFSEYKSAHRSRENWLSSCAIGVDIDHEVDNKHEALPTEGRERVESALKLSPLASLRYFTPRGFRLVFVLDAASSDLSQVKRAHEGAAALVRNFLGVHSLKSFKVDESCVGDLARLFYTPKATVHGHYRDQSVSILRRKPFTLEELIGAAPPPPPPTNAPGFLKLVSKAEGVSDDVKQAAARFNTDCSVDWNEFNRTCPFCRHNGCFGALPDSPTKWFCFSSDHKNGGRKSDSGFSGDALDYHAFQAKLSPVEFLRRQGYIEGRKPTIRLCIEEHKNVREATEALSKHRKVFQRAGALVTVVSQPSRPGERGSSAIKHLDSNSLRALLSESVYFERLNDEGEEKLCRAPEYLVKGIVAAGEWTDIRRLRAVISFPVLKPSGAVLTRPGYDDETGLFFEPTGPIPDVPETPTRQQVVDCVQRLLDVIADFPFASNEHRAVWVAGLLTPLARFAFEGPAPLVLVDANTPGAGKSLAIDAIGKILISKPMPKFANTTDDDEMRKRITSAGRDAKLFVVLDNISGSLGTPALDGALTTCEWEDRLLGLNQTIKVPLLMTWYGTGNNVSLAGDMGRRVMHARLESKEENPEERTAFRHPNLLDWIAENQQRILGAALTILRAYVVAGSPKTKLSGWGGYEGWSNLVRQAMVWAGLDDPERTRRELRNQSDTTKDQLAELIAAWHEVDPGSQGLTVQEAAAKLNPAQGFSSTQPVRFKAFMDMHCKGNLKMLGNVLKKFRQRNFEGQFIDSVNARGGVQRWRIVAASGVVGGRGGSGGSVSVRAEEDFRKNNTLTAGQPTHQPHHTNPDTSAKASSDSNCPVLADSPHKTDGGGL
jgi:hypothetical protein